MGDMISKIADEEADVLADVTAIIKEVTEQEFDRKIIVDSLLFNKKGFCNIGLTSEKLGRCYHRYYAIAFNPKDDYSDLSKGNHGNFRILNIGQSDLGEYVYYCYEIDSGD